MPPITVLMDMDGVLADFTTAALDAHQKDGKSPLQGVKPEHVDHYNFFEKYGMTEGEFWEPINRTPDFWENIPLYEEASEFIRGVKVTLLKLARKYDQEIRLVYASAPNRDSLCASGKIVWLKKHFRPFSPTEYMLGAEKSLMARPDAVLIDDREENVDLFRERGGRAILFPRPWNRIWSITGWAACNYVLKTLEKTLTDIIHPDNRKGEEPCSPAPDGEVISTSSSGGKKGVKPERYDLIPVKPLADLARHYGRGSEKYCDHNYRRGYEWSKSYAALQRHLNAFWNGEDIDPETGSPHLTAAAWHCFALHTFVDEHPEFDDRFFPPIHPSEKNPDEETT